MKGKEWLKETDEERYNRIERVEKEYRLQLDKSASIESNKFDLPILARDGKRVWIEIFSQVQSIL